MTVDLISGESVRVGEVSVRLEGGVRRAAVTLGSRSVSVRGTRGTDVVTDLLEGAGFRVAAALDVEIQQLTPGAARGGPVAETSPQIVLEAPVLAADELAQVALVEENGELRWVFPTDDQRRFVIDVDDEADADRGLVGTAIRKAVKFLAVKAVKPLAGRAVDSLVGFAEERLRPTRLRTFTADDYASKDGATLDVAKIASGSAALLFIHGTNSSTASAYGALPAEWVRTVNAHYAKRVFAFDHPTLSVSPAENADRFAALVREGLGDAQTLTLDVIAHSRGGLVARELAERPREGVKVRSITFVATPNNGTPLADAEHLGSFVDVLTNLAAVVPDNPVTDALEVVFELVKDLALDIAYDSLRGIKAMSPDGEYLRELNEPSRPEGTVYRAVAADFEPMNTAGILRKLRDRLFDKVFDGAMNDLIVPTRSAYLRTGGFYVDARERIVLESSRAVSHSTFWVEHDVLSRIDQWLGDFTKDEWPPAIPAGEPLRSDPNADVESAMSGGDGDDVAAALDAVFDLPSKFAQVIDQITGGQVKAPRRPPTPVGDVVLLPGIMGSSIATSDGLVWISPLHLSRGAFSTLTLDRPTHTARATGLNIAYTALASRLAAKWRLHLFPFDWRLDIDDAADALDEFITAKVFGGTPRPVHLVAHSMGGLVARSFIARHATTWEQMDDRSGHASGGRLVMLGTPNKGSYAIPLTLAGDDLAVKGLAAVDRRHTRADIGRIVATFPGAYQMLPAPKLDIDDDHERLYHGSGWGDVPVDEQLLARAQKFHERLDQAHADTDTNRMLYVAGDRQRTPGRIRIERGQHHFGMTDEGDGRVLHQSGELTGVETYYVRAGHGALVTDETVLDTIDDLLIEGRTDKLSATRFPRRGEPNSATTSATIPAAEVDPEPHLTAGSRGMTGAPASPRSIGAAMSQAISPYVAQPQAEQSLDHTVRVLITHASLEQARHPVIVGHYRGIPPEGAESFLDRRLDGALAVRFDADDYPEAPGEAIFVESRNARPPGGIVVGLGDFGQLSRSQLMRSIRKAAMKRALNANEQGETRPLGVSSVLVGTPGQYGLSVSVAMSAIVEGFAKAAIEINQMNLGVSLDELELIELYETRAVDAAQQLQTVVSGLPIDVLSEVHIGAEPHLNARRGGRPGLPTSNGSGAAWPRFLIERKLPPCPPPPTPVDDDATPLYPCGELTEVHTSTLPSLEFTQLGRGAQIDRLCVEFDDEKVTRMIAAAVGNPTAVDESYALFEMLFPHRQKLEIDDTDNLHLLVDEDSAYIPWELLYGRGDGRFGSALALRTGMLRQLRPARSGTPVRRIDRRPEGRRALVVGDPPVGDDYPRLPGARREAIEVARMLTDAGYDVEQLIFDDAADPDNSWLRIQAALYRHPYRVIHFATHGEIDAHRPERSGLLLAPGIRLTALDIRQMSATPDLVFVNACHVGRTGEGLAAGRSTSRLNEIAANLALQLMRNGVRAVIAAGWAVDDTAALTFARTAYENLLNGRHYGDAIHMARQQTYDHGRTNTWGAYQCYGDPNFSLTPLSNRHRRDPAVSAGQLVERLDVACCSASDATEFTRQQSIYDDVVAMDATDVGHHGTPAVYEALGRTYGELGCYADAVWAYRQALNSDNGNGRVTLKALEKLSNMEVRLAACIRRKRQPRLVGDHEITDTPSELYGSALARLNRLIAFEDTAERRNLVGGLHKKRAATMTESTRDASIRAARDAYLEGLVIGLERQLTLSPYSACAWIQLSKFAAASKDDLLIEQTVLELLEYQNQADAGALADHPTLPGLLITCLRSRERVVGDDLRSAVEEFIGGAEQRGSGATGTVRTNATNFWDDARHGDVALTRGIFDSQSTRSYAEAREHYAIAFRNRSAVRERSSVLDHLHDLVEILADDRATDIAGLVDELERIVAEELE